MKTEDRIKEIRKIRLVVENAEDMMAGYLTEVSAKRIQELIETERKSERAKAYEEGGKDEQDRWINQPANEHDKKIRSKAIRKFAERFKYNWVDQNGEQLSVYEWDMVDKMADEFLAKEEK